MTNPEFSNSGEMVASTLRGYRSWVLRAVEPDTAMDYRKDGWVLGSVGVGAHWESKSITARCVKFGSVVAASMLKNWGIEAKNKDHEAPHNGCTCGIYGWYEPEWANRYHTGSIMGVVEYSGRILMGSKGFRAEKAKVVAITMGSSKVARDQFAKSIHFIEHLKKFIEVMSEGTNNSIVRVNYGGLQGFLSEKMNADMKDYEKTVRTIVENMGIEYLESCDMMREKYPPELDTVENIIGSKLVRYGNGDPSESLF